MTISEDLFEQFCADQGIACERLEEETSKTPDYQIVIEGMEVVVEVKQIDPSKEDRKLLEEFEANGHIVHGGTPGDKVRKKIQSASPQMSAHSKGQNPAVLVLYNNLPFVLGNPLEPYNIRVGMYGLEAIVLSVPKDYSAPSVVDRKFGGKKKLTEDHNTSISAVAVLSELEGSGLHLSIYHNQHAAVPLPAGVFSKYNSSEFELSENKVGAFQEWQQISS